MASITTLMEGLAMGESARWHGGRFWCADWVAGEVLSVAVDGANVGKPTVATRSTSFPFCFDWTVDDELLVTGRRGLERLGPDGRLVPHTDLTQLSEYGWNEIAVHPSGAAYVNGINFDMMGADGMNFELGSKRGLSPSSHPTAAPASLPTPSPFPTAWPSRPTGRPCSSPNRSPRGCPPSTSRQTTASPVGGCGQRSTAAPTASASTPTVPCGVPHRAEPTRLAQGGQILQQIELDRPAFSVALGGPNGTTLFMVANEWNGPENIGKGPRTGVVYMTEVEVPAANGRNPD